MERQRETRRVSVVTSNGLSKRRYREEYSSVETHDMSRLRDRLNYRKERDRDRGGDRDRERDRDRVSNRTKRRRGERYQIHGSHREEGLVDESSDDESVNDDDDEEDAGAPVRMLPPNPSSSLSNHHHRRSFPPSTKVFKESPTSMNNPLKAPDEIIGVSVPRKARSASVKRSHDSWAFNGGDHFLRQASASPVRAAGHTVAVVVAPTAASASASPSPASVSPSSSNVSGKKKMKISASKQKPVKSSSKSTSSPQDEIEFEIAEVLYGMMTQPQGTAKREKEIVVNESTRVDLKDVNNDKSMGDAKSRMISTVPQSNSAAPNNFNSSDASISATAPKRKKARPVKYEEDGNSVRGIPISASSNKVDVEQLAKSESSSPNLEKNMGLEAEKQVSTDTQSAADKNLSSDSKPIAEESEDKIVTVTKEEPPSPKKDSPSKHILDGDCKSSIETATNTKQAVPDNESQREEKFQIDLMAPPPSRSSPERESEIDFVASDPKPVVTEVEMNQTELKPMIKDDEKVVKIGKESKSLDPEVNMMGKELESRKSTAKGERNIDLHVDVDKIDRESATVNFVNGNQMHQNIQKHKQQSHVDKNAQSSSLPLPMSMAGWPKGLPHMGYMTPLQGVVSMDGTTVSPAAIPPSHMLFGQQRPKRCAYHCHIARTIQYYQQFTRNPFWQATVGSALPYGAKSSNINVVPPSQFQAADKGASSVQDKGQGVAIFPGNVCKDSSSQAANVVDSAQRKQILYQPALPQGPPSNILHGPAFIFPMSQQQAAAATVRPGMTIKSPPSAGNAASSTSSSSSSMSSTSTAAAGAVPMSLSYPNMAGNEAQYLAIYQNGAYPIPVPAHVGVAPGYRGSPHPMPLLNGTFFPSHMVQPSQIQQQQLPSQSHCQNGKNHSKSSGYLPTQRSSQNQQLHSSGINNGNGNGNSQSFPSSKNHPSQSLANQQQKQHLQNHIHNQGRQLDGESSHSTADSRASRAGLNFYGQNFPMPMHPSNFALLTPATAAASSAAVGNPNEKKSQQLQLQGLKAGVESLPSVSFAMSFSTNNGVTAGSSLDISSLTRNHALLQNLPEAARHGYQLTAAVQATQQNKNYSVSDDGRANNDSSVDPERKSSSGGGKAITGGHSIMQQQHAVAAQSKVATTKNSSAYSDHMSSMAAKFPGALSGFPQTLGQNNGNQGQSLQWKNSVRSTTSQVPASSLASTPATLKSISQQQGRNQQGHTQISFGSNSKPSATVQGQVLPCNNQSPPSPMMVGSPTASSVSKSTGGSPRTTSSSTSNKGGQSSTLSSQQAKNHPSVSNQKSSPAGGRNISSILGHPHITNSSSSSSAKPQLQQLQKHALLQQAHMMYPSSYMQNQAQHGASSTNSVPVAAGFYLQRHRTEQQEQSHASHGSPMTSSTGVLSSSGMQVNATTDPAKAAAANNVKGGSLSYAPFSVMKPTGKSQQLVPPDIPYSHAIPSAVQVQPAEQKQPAGE